MKPLTIFACLLLAAVPLLHAADAPIPARPKPRDPALAPIADDSRLPRVLLVGDSVSIAYTLEVRRELAGVANVHRPPANCGSTRTALGSYGLERWLAGENAKWDVIHFNHGLHDLSYRFADDRDKDAQGNYAAPGNGGHQNVPLDEYRQNLHAIVARLRQTGAKLIFATTTPVPECDAAKYVKGSEVPYNEVARKVMAEEGVAIDDLWAAVSPQLDRLQIPRNVHFQAAGSAVLARQVAQSIRAALGASYSRPAPGGTTPARTRQATLETWRQRRFGIFLHWGPSSILELGSGSWARKGNSGFPQENRTASETPRVIASGEYLKFKGRGGGVPQEVYDNLFHVFNPAAFDAKEWVKLFKEAGAGYVVFTSKHHDGFCMFGTRTQEYNIMRTPFRRDVCKELADACRAEGLMIFFYYSPPDWWNPGWIGSRKDGPYVDSHFLPQVEELLTGYGPLDGIWWDGGQISRKYSLKTLDLIKQHQPWLIINGRLGDGVGGEFGTPEQTLGAFNRKDPWESCITMTGDAWFWNGGKDYKTATTCIHYLIHCACGDGNLLLDVGPRPDGRIDDRAAENYRAIGRWLTRYGETIRGTRGGPFKPGLWGGSTCSGNRVYLHITEILDGRQLALPALPAKVVRARCLTGGEVTLQQSDSGLNLRFSAISPVDTIVELTLTTDATTIAPIETEKPSAGSLADDATGTASSDQGLNASCIVHHAWEKGGFTLQFGEPGYEQQQAALAKKPDPKQKGFGWAHNHLGHPFRYWQAAKDDRAPWVELQLAAERTFSAVSLHENHGYTDAFAFDAFVNGEWKTLFSDKEMGLYHRRLEKPVSATRVRIRFLKINGPVALSSVQLF